MTPVANRLRAVQDRVVAACVRAGRDPDSVQLIAVGKTQPAQSIQQAYRAGQRHFGESYAQELRAKAGACTEADLHWHYMGRIQRNKAALIAALAHRVHALETVAQAEALAGRSTRPLDCLMAVNIGREPNKSGVPPEQAASRARDLYQVRGISLVGLMCLPPLGCDPKPYFGELADLARRGRADGLPLTELSMGMSGDFETAIACGATWVRVGTAIFGPRVQN